MQKKIGIKKYFIINFVSVIVLIEIIGLSLSNKYLQQSTLDKESNNLNSNLDMITATINTKFDDIEKNIHQIALVDDVHNNPNTTQSLILAFFPNSSFKIIDPKKDMSSSVNAAKQLPASIINELLNSKDNSFNYFFTTEYLQSSGKPIFLLVHTFHNKYYVYSLNLSHILENTILPNYKNIQISVLKNNYVIATTQSYIPADHFQNTKAIYLFNGSKLDNVTRYYGPEGKEIIAQKEIPALQATLQLSLPEKVFRKPIMSIMVIIGSISSFIILVSILVLLKLSSSLIKPIVNLENYIKSYEINQHKIYSGLDIPIKELDDMFSAFTKLQQRLITHQEEIEVFTFASSHNLISPLTTIEAYSEILSSELALDPNSDYRKYLDFIYSNAVLAKSLIYVIHSYLSYTQADKSTLLSLETLIDSVIQKKADLILSSNTKINVKPLPTVYCDHKLIFVVLEELIQNAMKFNKTQMPIINIYCDSDLLIVEDNGIGIAPEYYQSIFEPFTRLNPDHIFQGNGLGLALCKKIIHLHDWEISVDSLINNSTKFIIKIKEEDIL